MPSRAIVNYMYEMTQLGATPQQIEAGLSNAASSLLILGAAGIVVFGTIFLVSKFKLTH